MRRNFRLCAFFREPAGIPVYSALLLSFLFSFTVRGESQKPIKDMTAEELARHLERKAAAYKPPPEALRVLPFNPEEWETNENYDFIGDPRALKGGEITSTWSSFPPNLRTDGPNSNLIQTRTLHSLMYESLVGLHPLQTRVRRRACRIYRLLRSSN